MYMGHVREESTYYKYYREWLADAKTQGFDSVDTAIVELYRKHKSAAILAKMFGVTKRAIYWHLERLNEPRGSRGGYLDGGTRFIKHYVGDIPLSHWCKRNKVPYGRIMWRMRQGMSLEEAVHKPVARKKK